jgi:hypothetical protein
MSIAWATNAAVIYDNLNGGQYEPNWLYFATRDLDPCGQLGCAQPAQDFSPGAEFRLTSISIPLGIGQGAPNSVRISLYSSMNGVPGTVLESWLVNGGMVVFAGGVPAFPSAVVANSLLNPILEQGKQYFVGYEVPALTDFYIYSAASSLIETRTFASSHDLGNTWTAYTGTQHWMAFRVEGEPLVAAVPEPGTLVLLVGGLVGAITTRRRKASAL